MVESFVVASVEGEELEFLHFGCAWVLETVFGCLNEEIILLNEDIKDDAIISSIFNDAEFREDINGNYIVVSESDQDGADSDHLLKRRGAQHRNSPVTKQAAKQRRNDDQRSDLLAMKGQRIQQDIPNLIEFKPKKKRRDRFRDETQSEDKPSTKKRNSGYFFTSSIHKSEAEEASTNKNKLSRWMGKGKKGVHTSRAEF